MVHLLPAAMHRALMPVAHRVRRAWRKLRKPSLTGVSVVIADLDGRVLLVRHSYGPKVWALPGGGLNSGEDPEAGARREVSEELGMELGKIRPIAVMKERLSGCEHTAHLFAAICDAHPRPDRREVIEARFFPLHSLPEPMGEETKRRIAAYRARDTGSSTGATH